MTNQYSKFSPGLEDASDWLRKTYEIKKLKNPHYSQRVFAKQLGMSSGRLSEILLKRRLMSLKQLDTISDKLKISHGERELLQKSINNQKSKKINDKTSRVLLKKDSFLDEYSPLSEDKFATFAAWYHHAILNLVKTKHFENDPVWIAERLGISLKEANEALCRLKRLKYLKNRGKRLIRTAPKLGTTSDIPSAAIRIHHKQQLNKAILALDTVPVELRDISSMTVAVNVEKMAQAKEMIKNFRRLLSDFVEVGDKTEVYHLTISFSPLSINPSKKESVL